MTPFSNIAIATPKPTPTSPAATAARLALTALLISTSLSACSGPRLMSADQVLERMPAGKSYQAPVDGWFMSDALYQRYRRAVADKILETQKLK